ncbi:MAG: capsular biosynthesis protein [Oscillospiraceae bacterium]|nr:capsular biosynthesis protein [Oscillospiraceae bacterium]
MKEMFTDLHTHILPGFDDGARTVDDALAMLQMQKKQGVERVALTPHYYPIQESLDEFLERRQLAYHSLMEKWDADIMPILRLGAEVCYSPVLAQMDLSKLTIEKTDYLLLELPDENVPFGIDEVMHNMLQQGIIPILAHVERCAYFRQQPNRLYDLIQKGALAQASAATRRCKKDWKFVNICIRKGLVHIIASDTHRLDMKPPCLGAVLSNVDINIAQWSEEFAWSVWNNLPAPVFSYRPIKLGLLGYY